MLPPLIKLFCAGRESHEKETHRASRTFSQRHVPHPIPCSYPYPAESFRGVRPRVDRNSISDHYATASSPPQDTTRERQNSIWGIAAGILTAGTCSTCPWTRRSHAKRDAQGEIRRGRCNHSDAQREEESSSDAGQIFVTCFSRYSAAHACTTYRCSNKSESREDKRRHLETAYRPSSCSPARLPGNDQWDVDGQLDITEDRSASTVASSSSTAG